jgi:hypothetical protein
MARTVVILIRVFFAVVLGVLGVLAVMQGITMLAFRDFVLFGWPGAMMVTGILVGAGLLYVSGRLFKTTLALPAT